MRSYFDVPGGSFRAAGVDVPWCQGLRHGDSIYVTGQVAMKDWATNTALYPNDLPRQTRAAMESLRDVLSALGGSLDDVVKLNAFCLDVEGINESISIQATYFKRLPAFTVVVVPALVGSGFTVEIEAIAVVNTPKTFADRGRHRLPTAVPFSAAVKAGNTIYLSGQVSSDDRGALVPGDMPGQAGTVCMNLRHVLEELGASLDDVVKTNAYYTVPDAWRDSLLTMKKYLKSGVSGTGVGVHRWVTPGFLFQMDAVAVPNARKTLVDPPAHYPPDGDFLHHAVKCGDVVYVSAQVAKDGRGQMTAGDIAAQTRVVMENVKKTLAHAGAPMGSVVKKNTYYVDLKQEPGAYPAPVRQSALIRGTYFENGVAVTGFGVNSVGHHGAVIGVEAIAIADA